MSGKRVLVTGGAGFVGANLALALSARHPAWEVTALDSLHRRGSELNLPRLREGGVSFVHGDVRHEEDLARVGEFDALVECSAEPSVLAGAGGDTRFVVQANLLGAYHCLEACARSGAQLIFLSTSRVYPVAGLEALAYREEDSRYELSGEQDAPGASAEGVSESFPLGGARTLYGATKLAAELLIAEYQASFGVPSVVNRCGVIAGPWQMGRVDQGVFTHWVLSFYLRRPLAYIGYGGTGKQVRDLLHVDDLVDLVDDQLARPGHWAGRTFNVGGGRSASLSLREASALCGRLTGNDLRVESSSETRPGDVRIYLSDCAALFEHTDWRPRRTPEQTLADIFDWIKDNERTVLSALG